MKTITLKEFFELQGYGKGNKQINVSTFAELTGVSISYISKLLNNRYITSKKTKSFEKVDNYVRQYGYRLVYGDILAAAESAVIRQNKKLKMQIAELTRENEILKSQLESYESLKKMCIKIAKEEVK